MQLRPKLSGEQHCENMDANVMPWVIFDIGFVALAGFFLAKNERFDAKKKWRRFIVVLALGVSFAATLFPPWLGGAYEKKSIGFHSFFWAPAAQGHYTLPEVRLNLTQLLLEYAIIAVVAGVACFILSVKPTKTTSSRTS